MKQNPHMGFPPTSTSLWSLMDRSDALQKYHKIQRVEESLAVFTSNKCLSGSDHVSLCVKNQCTNALNIVLRIIVA